MQIIYALILSIIINNSSFAAINKIVRGPYLQEPSSDSMVIKWSTKKPSIALVELSNKGTSQTYKDLVLNTDHEILITDLKANTKYKYSIFAEKKNKREIIENDNNETEFSFKTFPDSKEARTQVLVLGDPGILSDKTMKSHVRKTQTKVIEGLEAYKTQNKISDFDFILTLGDNAYHNGTDKEFQKGFFEPYSELLANTPLLTCFGNHDSGLDRQFLSYSARSYLYPRGVYYDIFSLPGKEAYYSFEHGDAHFIVLDSFDSIWEDLKEDRSNYEEVWDETSTQKNSMLEWLKQDLDNNLSDWNIVIFHHPPFTEESEYKKQDIWRAWVNSFVVPLIESKQVDLALSGHIHNYQRSFPVFSEEKENKKELLKPVEIKKHKKEFVENYLEKIRELKLKNYSPVVLSKEKNEYKKGQGLIYSILGSSGAAFKELEEEALPIFATRLQKAGSVILNIDSDSLDYNFIGIDGEVLDSFTISK